MKSMWSGFISFGLVNIPVKLYTASDDSKLNLDMLHEEDYSRIRYAKICTFEDKEVPFDEIVKGYEYESGHYVILTDEDFEKANLEKSKSISVINFVDPAQIDFLHYVKPYFLEPNGSDKAYVLFREAMKKTGTLALVRFVFRNREHLGVVSPKEDLLILEQLRYTDEIRNPKELIIPKEEKIESEEMKMAVNLLTQMTKKIDLKQFKDTYRKELERIIDEKKAGKTPTAKGKVPVATRIPDLMEELRKSLEKEKVKTR